MRIKLRGQFRLPWIHVKFTNLKEFEFWCTPFSWDFHWWKSLDSSEICKCTSIHFGPFGMSQLQCHCKMYATADCCPAER